MTLLHVKLSEDVLPPRPPPPPRAPSTNRWHGYFKISTPILKFWPKRKAVTGSLQLHVCLVRQLPIVSPAERTKPRKPK